MYLEANQCNIYVDFQKGNCSTKSNEFVYQKRDEKNLFTIIGNYTMLDPQMF